MLFRSCGRTEIGLGQTEMGLGRSRMEIGQTLESISVSCPFLQGFRQVLLLPPNKRLAVNGRQRPIWFPLIPRWFLGAASHLWYENGGKLGEFRQSFRQQSFFSPLSMFLGPLFKGQLPCGFGASGAKNGRVEGRRVWVDYGEKKGG